MMANELNHIYCHKVVFTVPALSESAFMCCSVPEDSPALTSSNLSTDCKRRFKMEEAEAINLDEVGK